MTVEIIGDVGSCHMGQLDLALRLVSEGMDAGLDAVKFQLLTEAQLGGGNIKLDWHHLCDIRERFPGVRVFASVFDYWGIQFLIKENFREIKFPYSQWWLFRTAAADGWLTQFDRIYVSTDVMRVVPRVFPPVTWLYCIPEYPVRYVVDFEGLFPRFHGFSDHTLGIEQTRRAIAAGARVIEKHFTVDSDRVSCPDHQFALRPERLRELCRTNL